MQKNNPREIEFAPTSEIEARKREIQLLINIIEPDPEYQPLFLSDEAYVGDITGNSKELINKRLVAYFGESFNFPFDKTLWNAVDIIKQHFPEFPESL